MESITCPCCFWLVVVVVVKLEKYSEITHLMFIQVVNTLRLILQQILDTLRRSSHSSNVKGCSVAMITEVTNDWYV